MIANARWHFANSFARTSVIGMAIPPTLDPADEVIEWDGNFRYWGQTDMPTVFRGFGGKSGKHLLALSFSGFHPKRTLNRIR